MQSSGGNILVTGAAGYVGSHVCLALLEAGYDVVALDNMRAGHLHALRRVEELAGRRTAKIHEFDVRDQTRLDQCFSEDPISAVIHLAGLKSVAESVQDPIEYYSTNFAGSLALVRSMERHGVHRILFSSSCTVYGDPPAEQMPLTEEAPLGAINPYGRSKLATEQLLQDLCGSSDEWNALCLRYFNPVGAHESGHIGEHPSAVPNNLMPYIMQVAGGQLDELTIFGNDYPTHDGTCIRDYLHVVDVARAHVQALDSLDNGFEAINLATGVGSSVLDVLDAASEVVGRQLPHKIGPRRPGDAVEVYADATYAATRLHWTAQYDLRKMCEDHWRWQQQNPNGYPANDADVIDLRTNQPSQVSEI